MSFVDSKTMKEFKEKMVERFEEDEGNINKNASSRDAHTLCKLSMKDFTTAGVGFSAPLFKSKDYGKLNPGSEYTFCLGNRKWYCKKGNGNGFIPSANDYLHQKKRYTDFIIPGSKYPLFTWFHLLCFLFGEDTAEMLKSKALIDIDAVNKFPGVNRISPSMKFVIDVDATDFLDLISENGYMRYLKIAGNLKKFSTQDNYFAFRGKIYIAENAFERPSKGLIKTKFCERIHAYAHLIISLTNTGNRVEMVIGQLRD